VRNVVVTGAAHGIGAALARRFARAGSAVALLDLDAEAAEARAKQLAGEGARAWGLGCDVTSLGSCRDALGRVLDAWDGIDVLVNNAGITHVGLVRDTALERKEVHRIAPHLAEPGWMVMPLRSRASLLKFRAAVTAYEKLGAVEEADLHSAWGAAELEASEPLLRRDRFPHALAYREYLTDDARLVLANLRAAAADGAVVLNHAEVEGIVLECLRSADHPQFKSVQALLK